MDSKNNGTLFDRAASCARLCKPTGLRPCSDIKTPLRKNISEINSVYRLIEGRFGSKASIPAACQWLLDNRYIAVREAKSAFGGLDRCRRLRAGDDGIILVCMSRDMLHACGLSISEDSIIEYLRGVQSIAALPHEELCLFPAVLRSELVRELAELCSKLRQSAEPDELTDKFAAVFTSLRLISGLQWQSIIERSDTVEKIFMADPSGVYPHMDEQSRAQYRIRLAELAKKNGTAEDAMARSILSECQKAEGDARHIGNKLFKTGDTRRSGAYYIAANVLLTLFLSLLCGFLSHSAAAALLLLLPLSELTKTLLDYILLLSVPPRRLPRLDVSAGVPDKGRTICVISALLGSGDSGRKFAKKLEEYYLANRSCGKNLTFGILADLPEADAPESPEDEKIIASAAAAIDELNAKYSGGFYLFTRARVEDAGRGKYSGRERKRGAILALAELLCGGESSLTVRSGGAQALSGTKFIVTLDSDTVPSPDSIAELIGAMLHPLNAPVLDTETMSVISGHGLIHPRMCVSLHSAAATDFSRIFAGIGGTEPYSSLCGEVNMDLFDRGGFSGKGIMDARVLLAVTRAHIPDGRVLSHDALEGAYMRGGYMSDVEFSDDFPSSPLAYYRRSHRWIRGDWQNSAWIFDGVSPLPDIERWKLFDSLRRSLIAPATFAAILAGLMFKAAGLTVAAWAALIALASGLLISLAELASQKPEVLSARYHSRVLSGIGRSVVQTAFRLWFLPYEAWICVSAAATALWRMLISGKSLLEWETAAQGEKKKHGPAAYYKNMWLAPAAGVLLIVFAPDIFAKTVGLMWLLAPIAAVSLALPSKPARELPADDRQYLLGCAREIWGYFAVMCTEQDNFLPPDNFQQQPPVGIAHRTSPTNIGLALVSALCAHKLGFISEKELERFVGNMLETLEKVPKYAGHLCNWYDTRTLRPLEPKYLSTVDCGNLYACLTALKNGLSEIGLHELSERVQRLMSPMDFSIFYNEQRGLFHIGIDLEKGAASSGLYDLMASEARLTSYIAIAKGDVPRRHWRRLARVERSMAGYRGMASWTGTMFEYLMPELFLPLMPDSLLYETAKYCLFVQKQRRSHTGLWGISESAFFSLDPALNYRYKAHGCAHLALKRGQDSELVIAPYAAFLALIVEPKSAIADLRRMEKENLRSRFGFIEAVDFTPSRCRSSDGEKVLCYMAHHLGMSMIAVTNLVSGSCIQGYFMQQPEMSAYRSLLEEKVPLSSAVLPLSESESEKPRKGESLQWEKRGSDVNFVQPECTVLSNGIYNIMLTESGISSSSCAEMLVYRTPFKQLGGGQGVSLNMLRGNERLSLLPDPTSKVPFMWEFSEISCTFSCVYDDFTARSGIAVSGADNGEVRLVELFAKNNIEDAAIELSFEPVLADACDYVNHPAYWRLGIEAKTDGNCLMLHRLPRGRQNDAWLCISCDKTMTARAGRIVDDGYLSEPFVRAAVNISLKRGERMSLRFAVCVGSTPEEAYSGVQHMLAIGPAEYGAMVYACAGITRMSAKDVDGAMQMLSRLRFISAAKPFPAKSALWRYGISGDMPIICCSGDEDVGTVTRQFCLIRSCGVYADLVFITDEGGEYRRPVYSKVRDILSAHGLEALIGAHGGVRTLSTEALPVISSAAAYTVGEETESRTFASAPLLPDTGGRGGSYQPKFEYDTDGSFMFYVNRGLPARAWSNMLTNGRFGYIAADTGMGNMWYKNAREMRITPWVNDPSAVNGPESLEYITDSGRYSLFAANDGAACRVKFGFGFAVWEKSFGNSGTRCTAFIPPDADARVMIIELFGQQTGSLEWKSELLLSDNDNDYTAVSSNYVNSIFTATSSRSPIGGLWFSAMCSAPTLGWTCDLFSYIHGEFDSRTEKLSYPVFAARYEFQPVTVLVCGCCSEDELIKLCKPNEAFSALEAAKAHWRRVVHALTLYGTGISDRYMSGWAVYQTLACRLMGRCSMYQSGGAIGFRDQLQDAVNLILIDPSIAKMQILDCCKHQYLEGDVMHWWHRSASGDKGVRTHCSDDLLWLVWALCEYTEKTGDYSICDLSEYYVNSKPLEVFDADRYETPMLSACAESAIDHARRAIDCCISRGKGPHGLLYFGSGDWNDGMNGIGGESVWLTWFFACCVRRFSELLSVLCKPDAEVFRTLAVKAGKAADAAWDGQWYLRGYWPDGEKLGSHSSDCCRIDSIVQSWACFCADAQNTRADIALDSALRLLFDRENGIVKLFDPPFSGSGRDPGYIRSYGPGFRENGGQYTHAALWLAMACFRRSRENDGWAILRAILPECHDLSRYLAEPFVIAADVYTCAFHIGEAGWTWYTGSSGWYFRVFCEELLGLKLWHGALYIRPSLPDGFPECRVSWRPVGGKAHEIIIGGTIFVDGEKYDGKGIPYA